MFSKKQIDFGIVSINGNKVAVHETNTQSVSIDCGSPVTEARWSGDRVVVQLKNGEVRRYKSPSQFERVLR